jgi:hypothetical protein
MIAQNSTCGAGTESMLPGCYQQGQQHNILHDLATLFGGLLAKLTFFRLSSDRTCSLPTAQDVCKYQLETIKSDKVGVTLNRDANESWKQPFAFDVEPELSDFRRGTRVSLDDLFQQNKAAGGSLDWILGHWDKYRLAILFTLATIYWARTDVIPHGLSKQTISFLQIPALDKLRILPFYFTCWPPIEQAPLLSTNSLLAVGNQRWSRWRFSFSRSSFTSRWK